LYEKLSLVYWNTTPIHVIDFEGSRTTGILEYGVVTLHNGTIQSTHTRLCASKGDIPAREMRQHGIAETALKGLQPFDIEWVLFNNLRQSGILCAHAARVEHQFLKNTWPHPCSAPHWLEAHESVNDWGPWVDTLQLYRLVYPNLKSHKLMDLIHAFSLASELKKLTKTYCPQTRQHPHCALFDALASALLLIALSKAPGFDALTADWLLEHSAASRGARADARQRKLFH
jgi:DNA polymerase-3 subunit epsilon